jgi:hypothetical protein
VPPAKNDIAIKGTIQLSNPPVASIKRYNMGASYGR